MLRKARVFRPEASLLESKLLLSVTATPGVASGVPAETATLFAAKNQPLNIIKGRYSAGEDNRAADAPLRAVLSGKGKVSGLGQVQLSGSLDLGGFRLPGDDATGTLKLSGACGTVTLRLSGTGGNGQVPGATLNLTASVVSGTGAYKNFRRIGTAAVTFGQDTVQGQSIGGALTITLNLRPPVR